MPKRATLIIINKASSCSNADEFDPLASLDRVKYKYIHNVILFFFLFRYIFIADIEPSMWQI